MPPFRPSAPGFAEAGVLPAIRRACRRPARSRPVSRRRGFCPRYAAHAADLPDPARLRGGGGSARDTPRMPPFRPSAPGFAEAGVLPAIRRACRRFDRARPAGKRFAPLARSSPKVASLPPLAGHRAATAGRFAPSVRTLPMPGAMPVGKRYPRAEDARPRLSLTPSPADAAGTGSHGTGGARSAPPPRPCPTPNRSPPILPRGNAMPLQPLPRLPPTLPRLPIRLGGTAARGSAPFSPGR